MNETLEEIKRKQLNGDYKYHIWVDTSESGFAEHKAKFDTVVDAEDEINFLITTIESQKEEVEDIRRHQGEYIASLEFEVESLKAITELAVKGFKEIEVGKGEFSGIYCRVIARKILSEIERLTHE